MDKPVIALDFDGVIANYDKWEDIHTHGAPMHGIKEFINSLRNKFYVLIYTCRTNPDIQKPYTFYKLKQILQSYLFKHSISYDEVYVGAGKPMAAFYIDDRAVLCNPQEDKNAFEKVLKQLGCE
ncbi:MAG: hypothetical protein AABY22_33775 [Nanoarchaeota archaeon]